MSTKYRLISFLLGAVIIVFIGRFCLLAYVNQPVAGSFVGVDIKEGMTVSQVATILVEHKLAPSTIWYRMYATLDQKARTSKPGTYLIEPGSSFRQIAQLLALGPARAEVQLRLIEGWNIQDEAQYLFDEKRVKLEDTFRFTGSSPRKIGFESAFREAFPFLKDLPENRSLEGYLFPDTYRVWEAQLPEGLIRKQLQEFQDQFGDAQITQKSAPLKNLDEVVTLASIIEKEVRDPEDQRKVAGLFLRRLREGIALQSDATLTYITGSSRARATAEELKLDTPYNSYKYRGLPPSPICSPGASAIQAVLNPTSSTYRYFLTDQEGKVYYASTLEEHVANKRKAGY
jgi:UPF0755 protein